MDRHNNHLQADRIQALLENAVSTGEVAGVNLLVQKDGKDLFYGQAGYADIASEKPYQRDTIIRLYSMTKPITAAAAMYLMERGSLDPGQAVEEILPGFRNQTVWENGAKTPVRRKMRIWDLLSMTSGLPYGMDVGSPASMEAQTVFDEIDARLYTDAAPGTVEIANRLGQCGLAFHPGDAWQYGTSADVLGAVIECVSGKSFGAFLDEAFFCPLGMTDTGFYVPPEKQARLATVYEKTKDGLVKCPTRHLGLMYNKEQPPKFESGGAGLASTLDDYARFAQMLLNGGAFGGRQILAPSTVDYFTRAALTPWQQESLWRSWESLYGYGYGNLMRIMKEPGMACHQAWPGEYGWDGWLGSYFCNSPSNNVTILLSFQLKDTGTTTLTRRLRNLIAELPGLATGKGESL